MLEISNLNKSYTAGDETTFALHNVNLSLPDKGLVLITGKNGSGKTTLLNMIALADNPDSGSIRLNGIEITALSGKAADEYRRDNISYIFQTLNLVSTLTVKENLLLTGVDENLANAAIESIALKEHMNKLPAQLSQGQAQKVALQRAILMDTALLLADEPTSALDKESRAEVVRLLMQASENKLVLVITHDLNLFDKWDMLITFEGGKASAEISNNIKETQTSLDNQDRSNKQNINNKKFGYKYLFNSAVRAGRHKIPSTFLISALLLLIFICVNLFISTPYSDERIYNSFAKYYEQNDYKYVIAEGLIDDAPRNSCLNIKEFTRGAINDIDIAGQSYEKEPSLYYQGGLDCGQIIQSHIIAEEIYGKIPEGKDQAAITDYYADLLIYYYGYSDYNDVLDRAYLTLQFDGADLNKVKVVGITKTVKNEFDALKNLYLSDIENVEFHFRNSVLYSSNNIGFTSRAEEDAIRFKTMCEYSLAGIYMQKGFECDIAKSMQTVYSEVFTDDVPNYTAVTRLSAMDGIDAAKDMYKLKEGEGVYIRLSDIVSANEMYSIIKDCVNESQRRRAVLEFVKTIKVDNVSLAYNYKKDSTQAVVVGFIDDIGKQEERVVYATEDFADEYFQDCINAYISQNGYKSYIKADGREEVKQLLIQRNGAVYFPSVNALVPVNNAVTIVFLVSLIGACVLLVFTMALVLNDASYYFKNNLRDFAVLKAMGASMRKLAFISMIRYVFAIVAAILFSAVIAPIILHLINLSCVKPYVFNWITLNPLAFIADIVLALITVSLTFAFQYKIMRRRSISELLKD